MIHTQVGVLAWDQPRHLDLILVIILLPVQAPGQDLGSQLTLARGRDLFKDELHKVLEGKPNEREYIGA